MAKCPHCNSPLDVIKIERHNPNAVSCYIPPNNPNYPDFPQGGNLTYLEEIRRYPKRYWRKDIILINLGLGKGHRQVCVYPSLDGQPHGEAWQYMSTYEKRWAIEENARMLATLAQYPEWKVFF